jgi:hypothetical protein
MSSQIEIDHPKQELLFYVAQEVGSDTPDEVKKIIEEIARGRDWLIGRPTFIDEIHASNLGTPVRTVGGILKIYSALPPFKLPNVLDRQHFAEVEWLVEALRQFSETRRLAIEFELDGTFVGSVEDGRIDRTLAEGLLGEWRRELNARAGSSGNQ